MWGISVEITARQLWARQQGFNSQKRHELSLCYHIRTVCGVHPTCESRPPEALPPWVKRPGCEAGHPLHLVQSSERTYVFIIAIIVVTVIIVIIIISIPPPLPNQDGHGQSRWLVSEWEGGEEVCYIDHSSIDVPGSEAGARQNATSCLPAWLAGWLDAVNIPYLQLGQLTSWQPAVQRRAHTNQTHRVQFLTKLNEQFTFSAQGILSTHKYIPRNGCFQLTSWVSTSSMGAVIAFCLYKLRISGLPAPCVHTHSPWRWRLQLKPKRWNWLNMWRC
jgi:hypothetical protein